MMSISAVSLFQDFSAADPDVVGLLVFGSVARGDATARSDLDLAFLVRPGARRVVGERLGVAARGNFPIQLDVPDRPKRVLYAPELRSRVEAFVIEDAEEVARYLIGSRLPEPDSAVLIDKTGELRRWVRSFPLESDDTESQLQHELVRFQLAFDRGSTSHAAGDAYRAHKELEGAFEAVARVAWLCAGKRGFLFALRHFTASVSEDLRQGFAGFANPIDCSKLHSTKVSLVGLLRQVLAEARRDEPALLSFCEQVLARDRFWNHEDAAAWVGGGLLPGVLFRGASPSWFNGDPEHAAWMRDRRIGTRIDLRAPHELSEHPVVGLDLDVVPAPIDPWSNFPKDDPLHRGVDGHEASYRFSALRCGGVFRSVVETIANAEHPVFIHCLAGRDRTGVMVALVYSLVGVARDQVIHGYSRHAHARDAQCLARVLALVDAHGGIEALAARAGIDAGTRSALARRLLGAA